jgi:hypothetical protein
MHNTTSRPQKEEIPTNQTTPPPRRKIRITKEIDLLVAQPQRERESGAADRDGGGGDWLGPWSPPIEEKKIAVNTFSFFYFSFD